MTIRKKKKNDYKSHSQSLGKWWRPAMNRNLQYTRMALGWKQVSDSSITDREIYLWWEWQNGEQVKEGFQEIILNRVLEDE